MSIARAASTGWATGGVCRFEKLYWRFMPKSLQLTPMLRHYLEVKADHPDAILLYRMGDFYEMFFEDAVRAAPVLEVTLTARQKGTENEAPMCGVPHHALGTYLAKLLRAGLKVAICDQVEDPAQAKGLVKREVTRVITPGTLTDPDLLQSDRANYLASVLWSPDGAAGAFLDVSTGDFLLRRWSSTAEALDDLAVLQPQEVLTPESGVPSEVRLWLENRGICQTTEPDDSWPERKRAQEIVQRQVGTTTLKGFGLEEGEPAVRAAAGALQYARDTQRSDLSHVRSLRVDAVLGPFGSRRHHHRQLGGFPESPRWASKGLAALGRRSHGDRSRRPAPQTVVAASSAGSEPDRSPPRGGAGASGESPEEIAAGRTAGTGGRSGASGFPSGSRYAESP